MGAESVSWRPARKSKASLCQSTAGRSGTTCTQRRRAFHTRALHTELGESQDSRLPLEEALSQLSSPPHQRNQKSVKGPNTVRQTSSEITRYGQKKKKSSSVKTAGYNHISQQNMSLSTRVRPPLPLKELLNPAKPSPRLPLQGTVPTPL